MISTKFTRKVIGLDMQIRAKLSRIESGHKANISRILKEGPNGGHVGSLQHLNSQLKEIEDQIFKTGEYAQ